MINQCSSCGGFCKKSGCERENVKPTIRNNIKELTDEEIKLLAKAYSTIEGELNAPAFARAVLRKAQEK
jgi:hypothetical protein